MIQRGTKCCISTHHIPLPAETAAPPQTHAHFALAGAPPVTETVSPAFPNTIKVAARTSCAVLE